MAKLKLTLTRGLAGKPDKIRKVTQAMGLKKIGATKIVEDTPVIRGMIRKTEHLVSVETVE